MFNFFVKSGDIIEADEVIIAAGNGAEFYASQAGDRLLSYPIKGYVMEVGYFIYY